MMAENAFKADWPSFALGFNTGKSKGGAELNIAYGDTAPEDTTKLWVKTAEPNGVLISPEVEQTEVDGESCFELKETMPVALHSAGCCAIGSKIYIVGGTGKDGKAINAVTVYDTEKKTFKTHTNVLWAAVSGVAATAVGTRIYIVGGSKNIWYLDTETMTTTTCEAAIPVSLLSAACGAIGTDLYIMGGISASTYQKTVYKYDTVLDDSVNQVGTMKVGTSLGCCTLVGTTFYVYGSGNNQSNITTFDTITYASENFVLRGGGVTHWYDNGSGANFGDNFLYLFKQAGQIIRLDTITKKFEVLAIKSPFEVRRPASATIGNKFYRLGGSGSGTSSATVNNYDALDKVSVFMTANLVPLVEDGSLYMKPSTEENIFPIVNAKSMAIEVGVESVYKGNAEGIGEPVEAALYKDGEWVTI